MKIKIFALTHKKFEVPQDKMYQPLQVGREEKEDLGYLCDNTGDNISAENCTSTPMLVRNSYAFLEESFDIPASSLSPASRR